MSQQLTDVAQLNALLDTFVRNWMCIINLDVEFYFTYDDDDPNPRRSNIIGYEVDGNCLPGFGGCKIGDEGKIIVTDAREQGAKTANILTYIGVDFPKPIKAIFDRHACGELFENANDYVGFDCQIFLPDVEHYSVMTLLSGTVSDLRLDAFSETVFRPNASALHTALQPYALWLDYAALLADRCADEKKHELLISDLRDICAYVSLGGQLSFAKLTSLCDIAGSLQPVRSLVHKNMSGLVV